MGGNEVKEQVMITRTKDKHETEFEQLNLTMKHTKTVHRWDKQYSALTTRKQLALMTQSSRTAMVATPAQYMATVVSHSL